ncbi:hypothetical protein HQ308_05290 [Rhodococcus sp. BP-241]|uniref:hypothetical protein n=1 Tax=Rhodococcus sp. BP-241 TaxID=2739441 RepID=UPI001C9B868B|nr:hypothetical protein [Rhodococcus sp. BP-241]MBY6706210.1 hypothetical protein [Rhodococcus sp. BP-241]
MGDRVVEGPIQEVVLDAVYADESLGDDAKYLVMAALEGDDVLDGLVGVGIKPTFDRSRRVLQSKSR